MVNLSKEEVAYIAGLMDGEGTLTMSKDAHPTGDRKLRFRVRFTITTTSTDLVAYLMTKLPWSITETKHLNLKHATSYRLSLTEGPAEEVVRLMLPHLVIKKRQGELFLRYRELQKFCYANRKSARIQIKSIRLLRDWFWTEFHRLNARGPVTVTTNTPDMISYDSAIMKIESELRGNVQRVIGDDAPPSIN